MAEYRKINTLHVEPNEAKILSSVIVPLKPCLKTFYKKRLFGISFHLFTEGYLGPRGEYTEPTSFNIHTQTRQTVWKMILSKRK